MAEKEIILQGEDGQVDELVLTTQDQASCNSLEECVRMLFPQEGEAKPRLRFKGFEGDWEKVSFGDLYEHCVVKNDLTFGKDKIISVANMYFLQDVNNSDDDYLRTYNVFRLGDIAFEGHSSKEFAHGRFVENTIGDGIVSHIFDVFRPKSEKYDLMFWKYAINNEMLMGKILSRCTKASTMMNDIVADEFLKESFLVPSYEEQKKIGEFLSRLDTQIKFYQEQFDRLKQLKSACLETMFPQKDTAVPSLRFKEFDGAWGEDKLSTYATRITRKNDKMESDLPLTISSSEGLIAQTAFFNNVVASSNMSGYYLLKKGEFAYNKSYSNGYPFGAVKKLEKYEQGALSPLYIVFSLSESVDHDYIVYFFETDLWHKEVAKRAAEGARNHGLLNIGAEDFLDINITFPVDKKEQEQIASFFRKLDAQIISQQQQLERLKQMKQSCLGLLFADNQSITTPPLRFKGFNGEWIMIRFSDMAQRISTSGVSDKLPSVEFEDIVSGEGVLNKDVSRKNVVKKGVKFEKHDVLFGKLRPYLKNILYADFNGIAVGDFWVLRASEAVDPYFLYILVSTHQFMSVANISSGSKMPRADWNLVSNSNFAIPSSIDEQRSIASFFRNLDGQINSKSQQVEKLKQVKKACLNQFIA